MGARWYNPTSATFRNRDTYAGELRTPISLNRYTYAANNPARYWDPTGYDFEFYGDEQLENLVDRTQSTDADRAEAANIELVNTVATGTTEQRAILAGPGVLNEADWDTPEVRAAIALALAQLDGLTPPPPTTVTPASTDANATIINNQTETATIDPIVSGPDANVVTMNFIGDPGPSFGQRVGGIAVSGLRLGFDERSCRTNGGTGGFGLSGLDGGCGAEIGALIGPAKACKIPGAKSVCKSVGKKVGDAAGGLLRKIFKRGGDDIVPVAPNPTIGFANWGDEISDGARMVDQPLTVPGYSAAIRPERLDHIFVPKHKLDPLLTQFGSREAVVEQMLIAIRNRTPVSGVFEIPTAIGGQTVVVRGAIVDGVPRLSTAFTP